MSITLANLFPVADLDAAVEAGLVRQQVHPSASLRILNYTERTVWERAWGAVTTQCRGLIADDHGRVVARPFAKFWNYGENPEEALDLSAKAEVTDKVDGSLAVIYPAPDGWAVATRGSFTSDQAIHATNLLRTRYAGWEPPEGVTVLAEIVYPSNRIVLDYGPLDDLILLGGIDIATGRTVPLSEITWPGPRAQIFDCATLAEALAMPPRDNAEGVVVRMVDTDVRVKIKLERYVYLHRLITGMNARVVWERIGEGKTLTEICEGLPEEFWPWVHEVGGELIREKNLIIGEATAEHERIIAGLSGSWTRKDYALEASKSQLRPWLFLLLDGRDPSAKIWRTLRPSGERTLVAYSEDTA